MKRIEQAFARAASEDRTALIAYISGGYPSLLETTDLVTELCAAGADIIELGIPFTDAFGDGPVIRATADHALRHGASVAAVLETVEDIRAAGVTTPIVLMGYCNPFLRYGLTQLYDVARESGADGLVVPDLPVKAADRWLAHARQNDLGQVFFTAHGSSDERIATQANASRGFLYALATDGVTGTREHLDPRLDGYLARVRRNAGGTPVAVGFGISRPEHVTAIRGKAEGVIVGSAILRAVDEQRSAGAAGRQVSRLVSALREAC